MSTSIAGQSIYAYPVVDSTLSDYSTNPVENQVLTEEITPIKSAAPGKATAIVNAANGDVAIIKDGAANMPVKQLVAEIEPVQDLNGYDHPWPAGGSINLFNPDTTTDNKRTDNVGNVISSNGWCVSDYIPVTADTDYYVNNAIPSANGYAMCFYNSEKSFLRYIAVSGGGSTVGNSGADAAFLRVTVKLSTKTSTIVAQSSSPVGFVPYSNICPVTGWTGANIYYGYGDNCANMLSTATWGKSAVYYAKTDSMLRVYQTDTDIEYASTKIPLSLKADTPYLVDVTVDTVSSGTVFFGLRHNRTNTFVSNSYIRGIWYNGNRLNDTSEIRTTNAPGKYTILYKPLPSDLAANVSLALMCTWTPAGKGDIVYRDVSVREQFALPVSWQSEAGTVYGGSLTINEDGSGTLIKDKEIYSGSSFATSGERTGGFYTRLKFSEQYKVQNDDTILCNKATAGSNAYDKWYISQGGVNDSLSDYCHMYVPESAIEYHEGDDISALLNAAYDASEFQVYLTLPTPVTYNLTAAQVECALKTLYGINHIWCDTSGTSVSYCADTRLYIQNAIENALAGT